MWTKAAVAIVGQAVAWYFCPGPIGHYERGAIILSIIGMAVSLISSQAVFTEEEDSGEFRIAVFLAKGIAALCILGALFIGMTNLMYLRENW